MIRIDVDTTSLTFARLCFLCRIVVQRFHRVCHVFRLFVFVARWGSRVVNAPQAAEQPTLLNTKVLLASNAATGFHYACLARAAGVSTVSYIVLPKTPFFCSTPSLASSATHRDHTRPSSYVLHHPPARIFCHPQRPHAPFLRSIPSTPTHASRPITQTLDLPHVQQHGESIRTLFRVLDW